MFFHRRFICKILSVDHKIYLWDSSASSAKLVLQRQMKHFLLTLSRNEEHLLLFHGFFEPAYLLLHSMEHILALAFWFVAPDGKRCLLKSLSCQCLEVPGSGKEVQLKLFLQLRVDRSWVWGGQERWDLQVAWCLESFWSSFVPEWSDKESWKWRNDRFRIFSNLFSSCDRRWVSRQIQPYRVTLLWA